MNQNESEKNPAKSLAPDSGAEKPSTSEAPAKPLRITLLGADASDADIERALENLFKKKE